MQNRYITLDTAERATLEIGRHHHPQHQFRARCQGLLWSADGHSVSALSALLHVSAGTVYTWFNRWEQGGLAGLANAKGQGPPRHPTGRRRGAGKSGRGHQPSATQRGDGRPAPGTGQRIFTLDAEAFFKKGGGKWRRFRHSLKEAQDLEEYALKVDHLQGLAKEGTIDLYYGDEPGFSLTSAIPYGWQFPGEHVATRPRHSQRFNVLGFYNATTNDLHTATREGSLDAAFVIDTLDAWAATRTRPTVLVFDNARIHHSATFQARLQHWEDQDVHIFYLPTYSPHLNKIETLWRKTKYKWLRPEAYIDFKTLKTAVWHILDCVGQQFTIQFAP